MRLYQRTYRHHTQTCTPRTHMCVSVRMQQGATIYVSKFGLRSLQKNMRISRSNGYSNEAGVQKNSSRSPPQTVRLVMTSPGESFFSTTEKEYLLLREALYYTGNL